MPQLMPLMWVSSIMMGLVILVMLINMYSYVEEFEFLKEDKSMKVSGIMFKW